jgi:PAS domain S-box-containing protein
MWSGEGATAREQHARYAALSAINDLIYVYDEEFRVVFGNRAYLALFGLTFEEAVGRPVRELLADDQVADQIERDFRRVIETGRAIHSTTPYTSPTGACGHFEYILQRFEHEHGVWVVGSSRDVSERIRLSETIERTNQQLTDILESITDAFYTLDTSWRFTYVNARAAELLRRSRHELIGANIWDEFPRLLHTKLYPVYLQAMQEQLPASFEFYYAPLASWFEVHAYPSIEHMSVYFREINDNILIRRELQASERRLAEAQRIARLGNWEVNLKTSEFTCSSEQYHIFGLDPAKGIHDVAPFEQAVHPDDLPLIQEQRDRVVRPGEGTFDIEYRIYRPDGEERIVHTLAELANDEEGDPCRLVGTVHDVTERKEIERTVEIEMIHTGDTRHSGALATLRRRS